MSPTLPLVRANHACGAGLQPCKRCAASGHTERVLAGLKPCPTCTSARFAARAGEAHARTLDDAEGVVELANLDEAVDRHAREHLARAADGPIDLQRRDRRGGAQADVLRETVRAERAAARHLAVAKRSTRLWPSQGH